jgi:hypothetical protein
MKKQIRQSMIKDDKSIRKITQQWEQERQRLGIEAKPHDFKTATELWKSGQAFEDTDETQPEEVIELVAAVKGNTLELNGIAPFPVHGNEIHIGKRKIVITLEQESSTK